MVYFQIRCPFPHWCHCEVRRLFVKQTFQAMATSCVNFRDVFSTGSNPARRILPSVQADDLIELFGRNVEFRLYDTKAHKEIYQMLFSQANNLCSSNYINTQGVCCSTMVGAKGIGKTFTMKVFATVAPNVFPSLITVYASLNNILVEGSPFRYKSIMGVLCDELRLHGVDVSGNGPLGERIVGTLLEKKLYVHLLVDELDQLYKANGAENPLAVQTLHELSYLGNQSTGRIAVVVCGSSSLMENLITTNATGQIQSEFPLLVSGAINLNGTKYATKRVYSTLPTDLEAVGSIVGVQFDEVHKPYLRSVAYLSGCSARKVDRVVNDGNDLNSKLAANSPENSLSGSNTLGNDEISSLRNKIYKALVKKNKVLCRELFDHADVKTMEAAILSTEWEVRLKPLQYQEVEKLWEKMIYRKLVCAENRGSLNYNVLHLADRNWLTVDGIVHSKPNTVYPFSMSSLATYYLDASTVPSLSDHIYRTAAKGTKEGGKIVLSPRVVAAGATVAAAALCTIS